MTKTGSLPDKFKEFLNDAAGASRASIILDAIENSEAKISIRVNPLKVLVQGDAYCVPMSAHNMRPLVPIPWCREGYYLAERPVFTLDPSLHAGAYYVQEPSSMFLAVLEPVLKQMDCNKLLDLCAAPGGKTTHLISMMPRGAKLVANEVIRTRVAPLKENIVKWGDHSVIVTNLDARNFLPDNLSKKMNWSKNDLGNDSFTPFDFILVDAPCSGEGMFRKDPSAISEWSEENVKLCAARQKRILADIWDSLRPGGLLAFSTCTFNLYENDGNVAWLKKEYGAEIFDLLGFYETNSLGEKFNTSLLDEWGIVLTAEGGFQFFPGLVEGEGFFFALLQKPFSKDTTISDAEAGACEPDIHSRGEVKKNNLYSKNQTGNKKRNDTDDRRSLALNEKRTKDNRQKGQSEQILPEHEYALSVNYAGEWPSVELSKQDALLYLSRNSIKLEGAPLGYLRVTYNGLGLGFVKNLGNRANNLYPMNWRIRMDV